MFPATHEEHISPHSPGPAPAGLRGLFGGKAKGSGLSAKDRAAADKMPGSPGNPMK